MQAAKQRVSSALEAASQTAAEAAESGRQAVQATTSDVNNLGERPQAAAPLAPATSRSTRQGAQAQISPHSAGPLERVREKAAHAVEGIRHTVERVAVHLPGGGAHQPTAEQRTGEAMHMAKAAEGRNVREDDALTHAIKEALKPEEHRLRAPPEVSGFPETLGDAIHSAQAVGSAEATQNRVGAELAEAEEAAGGTGVEGGPPAEPPKHSKL